MGMFYRVFCHVEVQYFEPLHIEIHPTIRKIIKRICKEFIENQSE
jgi:hypothetical protein